MQVQDARSREDPHKREAPSLLPVRQELQPRGESQDPREIAHRRETVRLPGGGLQQGILKLLRQIQAHEDPLSGEALLLQGAALPKEIHRSLIAEETRENVQALCEQQRQRAEQELRGQQQQLQREDHTGVERLGQALRVVGEEGLEPGEHHQHLRIKFKGQQQLRGAT